jgi:hypothetical protein
MTAAEALREMRDSQYGLSPQVRAWADAIETEVNRLRTQITALLERLDDLNGTPCEQIRHRQEVEKLHRALSRCAAHDYIRHMRPDDRALVEAALAGKEET